MEPLYKIEEQSTTGWHDWDEDKPNMTKDECMKLYNSIVGDGISPSDVRIKRVS